MYRYPEFPEKLDPSQVFVEIQAKQPSATFDYLISKLDLKRPDPFIDFPVTDLQLNNVTLNGQKIRQLLRTPTESDVSYGPDQAQQLDFWKAPSEGPNPLVFEIHGGGWIKGDKRDLPSEELEKYLAAGISVGVYQLSILPQMRNWWASNRQ